MSTHPPHRQGGSRLSRIGAFVAQEIREVIPPTIFFFFGFNLVLLTKRLVLAEYLIKYAGFAVATTGALIVAKVVLVTDKMPLMRRFDYAPLAYPIVYKTLVYTTLVMAVRLLEALIRYLISGGALGGDQFVDRLLGEWSWPRFIATQLWVTVLFLVWVTATELNTLFGDGELYRIFFTRRSTALKTTRRARIRLLTRLSRLTDAHPIAELEDPTSAAHDELIAILRDLSRTNETVVPPAPPQSAQPATAIGL